MRVNAEGAAASRILKERRDAIAERVTRLYFEAHPLLERCWKGALRKCTEDNRYHLDYLCEALSFGHASLFIEYAVWAAALLARLNISGEALAFNLDLLKTILETELQGAGGALASQYLDAAIAKIGVEVADLPSFLDGDTALDVLARDYLAALMRPDRQTAASLIMDEADRGTSIKDLYLQVFQRVLREAGRLWHSNQIGVAQEHYCTACTQLIMSQLYPRIFRPRSTAAGWYRLRSAEICTRSACAW
jgi:hypothetical protein